MQNIDWYEIKFLESSSNLKEIIKTSVGRTPSTKVANEIAVCIQQGRLFFEAASTAPLEIQPLQLFYGVVGFSKAITLARNLISLATLAQSHGLSDVSAQNATLEGLSLRVDHKGAFQQFNDTIAPLGRISYIDSAAMPTWVAKPFDDSSKLCGKEFPIKEILARVPYLQHLYERTFAEPAKTWHMGLHHQDDDYVTLRIDDPELFTDRDSLAQLVKKWRSRYPFLERWCFSEASKAWGNAILIFGNIDKEDIDEFSTEFLIEQDGGFTAGRRGSSHPKIEFSKIMSPVAGGITKTHDYVIQPYHGAYVSEFCLQYLGTFLLSSLVRYRPQIWQHAISRSALPEIPVDDRSLALIERFLEIVFENFPRIAVHAIDYLRPK